MRKAKAGRSFSSLDDALRTAREFPTFATLLGSLSGDEREDVWNEIAREWSHFARTGRVEMPGEQLVVSGENPR